jgi:uncharacterized protein YceK
MKKAVFIIALVVATLVMTGCPSVKLPIAATGNPVGSKTGQSSGQILFGVVGDVDASIQSAAAAGGITKISTVDLQTKALLGSVILTFTTTVTGE